MKLKVICDDESKKYNYLPGPNLLEILQNDDYQVDTVCGANGTCLKCRVQISSGFCPVSEVDRKTFTAKELQDGWRLSCQVRPKSNLEVNIPKVENYRNKPRVIKNNIKLENNKKLKLVCDLGSTGLVVALGYDYGNIICEVHLLNKQVRYGSDVMTRLHNATKYGVGSLQKALLKSLEICLKEIPCQARNDEGENLNIICAGNTVMTSFLHAWDIQNLAVSPFQPHKISSEVTQNFATMPMLGGFVGGDTTAAILFIESLLKREKSDENSWMLVDIGTNTEIVLKDEQGAYWFASAPAGPAFEGGNITKGMRAEPGAVSRAKYNNNNWQLEIIGQDVPKGICGSGLIEIICEAVKNNLIHKDGLVPDGKLDVVEDKIYLLADDIREFQLAKSATRTAIDILIDKSGVLKTKINKLYFAGTFAENLDQEAVKYLGLLPSDMKIECIGNASLKGAFLYAGLSDLERKEFENKLSENKKQIELALEDDFQEAFVSNLNF